MNKRNNNDAGATTTINGTLEDFMFRDAESFFCVATLDQGGGRQCKIVGKLPGVNPGEILELHGRWRTNRKYGDQEFAVESFTVSVPQTVVGIQRYLASGLVDGIGPELARRLVAAFGAATLDVIEREPWRLREVAGIGPVRAEAIGASWKQHAMVKEVMVFLHSLGISSGYAAKIFKQYGEASISVVKANPYVLTEISGIGFKKADEVALGLGISRTDVQRIQAGVLYTLEEALGRGHCYLTGGELHQQACKLLGVGTDAVDAAVGALVRMDKVKAEALDSNTMALYVAQLFAAEVSVAERLAAMAGSSIRHVLRATQRTDVELAMGLVLSDQQWEAIDACTASRVLVVTGGPGTGKTTIVRGMLNVLSGQGRHVLLAAPTGRASKRMEETTGREAQTIHRLLEYHPEQGWRRNRENPLTNATVVVDEFSMVDLPLAYRLLDALGAGCQLVIVGDVDQLPSVGPGCVLADLISSSALRVVRLTHVFRQALNSMIVSNAHRINGGNPMDFEPGEGQSRDMFWVEVDTPADAQKAVLGSLRRLAEQGYDLIRDVQVLTPIHRGEAGTADLNRVAQAQINPDGRPALKRGEWGELRIGDRVIQMRNNYDLGVFNGDVGTVVDATAQPFSMRVQFEGNGGPVEYDREAARDLVLAYCVTVHKSQGSEYPVVVVVVHWSHYIMLVRNLLYTAITRGKRMVIVVGQGKAMDAAIGNNRPSQRNTRLGHRLRKAAQNSQEPAFAGW